jgi:hypothetical protein
MSASNATKIGWQNSHAASSLSRQLKDHSTSEPHSPVRPKRVNVYIDPKLNTPGRPRQP